MKPLICFYKNQYIRSDDFTLIEKEPSQTTVDFLNLIEKRYFTDFKIIQIDFDAFATETIIKKHYYNSPVAQVFIVHSHKVISTDVLKTNLSAKDLPRFTPDTSQLTFCRNVEKIVADINAGRFYQVNLTAALTADVPLIDSYHLFKSYFPLFKANYAAFLPSKDFDILCFSPELFLLKKNSQLLSGLVPFQSK